ncbi:hypothetical protein FACS1894199_16570 [Bacteroidia bacterium]|nr:hypothetical protein FACS1894199_16570 [Bacteroidia bacterium]
MWNSGQNIKFKVINYIKQFRVMKNEKITTCNICGATVRKAHEVLFKGLTGLGDWQEEVAICDSCGFIFAANPFMDDVLADRYKNLSKYEFDSGDYQIGADVPYMKRCKRQFDFILENVDSFDSILEVGAASGYNLSLYKDEQKIGHSVAVMGIEPSGVNCKLAQKNYDIQLFNGLFSEYIDKNSSQKFDLIFFSHVLEHIVNPRDFIEQCKTINNKYIFIEVPTFDYKFENEFLGMFSDEHINYFTFESLSNLMNSCGYTIVEAEMPLGIQVKIAAGVPALVTLWVLADEQHNLYLQTCQ